MFRHTRGCVRRGTVVRCEAVEAGRWSVRGAARGVKRRLWGSIWVAAWRSQRGASAWLRFHSLDALQLSACTPLDCGSIRARCDAAESALRLIAVFRSMRCSSGVCTPLDCGRGWGGASWQGTAWPFAAVFRHAIGRGWGWCAPGPACRALHPYAVLCVALVLRGVCFIVIML